MVLGWQHGGTGFFWPIGLGVPWSALPIRTAVHPVLGDLPAPLEPLIHGEIFEPEDPEEHGGVKWVPDIKNGLLKCR